MTSKTLYLRLLGYARPYWRMFALSLVTMVLLAATEPVLPALMKPMLDGSFVEKDPGLIRWMPLALVGLFVVRGLATFASSYSMAYVGSRVVMDLRRAMFDRLLTQPAPFFDNVTKGHLVATAAYNVSEVTTSATTVITSLVRDVLSIVGLLGWMLWLNWKLSVVAFVMVPPVLAVFRFASKRLRHTSREIQANLGDITHVLGEAIAGHKIVKVFDGLEYERRRFTQAVQHARHYAMKQSAVSLAHLPIIELLAAVALATIMYIATLQAVDDDTSVGGFVSFMVAMLMLSAPLRRLSSVMATLQRGLAASESVFALIDLAGEPDTGTRELGRARGELRFEGVRLIYPGKSQYALDGIDLILAAGQTVALVGASGGGKTSLVNLVPRFYAPSAGRVLLDGVDLREIRLGSLRANIAMVSQDVTLFNDTVAANIAYGRYGSVGQAEIEAAARAANALDFILELPQGFATPVGENGARLSGGQRQRIAIARALLKNAPILILDEATSALDTESERQVQDALDKLVEGRTTLVIAHRLSTIEAADRILVLDKGRVVESGTHAELLAQGGVYARLHALQFREDAGGG